MLGDFHAQLAESEASDRSFGVVAGAFFLFLGLGRLVHHNPVRWWAVAVAALCFLIAFTAPHVLRKPKLAWLFLGFLLGRVVNPIVLGLLFVFLITPLALVMRLTGRDPLRLRRAPDAITYWQAKDPASSDMTLQF